MQTKAAFDLTQSSELCRGELIFESGVVTAVITVKQFSAETLTGLKNLFSEVTSAAVLLKW